MSILKRIESKLRDGLAPERLDLIDESPSHAGHAGVGGAGEADVTHLTIAIVSDRFDGLSRLARQRLVHSLIDEEIRVIHSVQIAKTATKDEYAKEPKKLG